MSRRSKKMVPVLVALLLSGGCILGPQPEPPDMNEGAENRNCPSDTAYEDDYDCQPSDDEDDDGFADCNSAGVWTGEDGCDSGADGDPDGDVDPGPEEEPPPGHESDDGPVSPTQDLVQWPVDPSVGFDDDSDVDTVVID